jgi:hypothetical protein
MTKTDKPDVPKMVAEIGPAIQALIDGVSNPLVKYGPNADGYGKCVEAMWRAAYIAHEYVASQLGVTVFQHSISSLTIMGVLRDYEGPYKVIDGANALYPQYDLVGDTQKWLDSEETRQWLAEQARERIAESEAREPITLEDGTEIPAVDGNVRKHWEALAAYSPASA